MEDTSAVLSTSNLFPKSSEGEDLPMMEFVLKKLKPGNGFKQQKRPSGVILIAGLRAMVSMT